MPKIVFGFIGVPCSGNTTAAERLIKKHGFFYTSTSGEIRDVLKKRGEKVTRDSLQRVGGELRQVKGADVLAKRSWKKIISSRNDKSIIDGIRGIEEVEFLKKQQGFYLFNVIADPRIRFKRMKRRNRENDPVTWVKFLKSEKRDKKSDGRDVQACLKAADFKIENNGTPEEFYRRLERILEEIKAKI